MQNIDKIYYIMYNNKNRYNIIIMFEYFRGGFYMYCRNCGEQIDSNAAICVKCGLQRGLV